MSNSSLDGPPLYTQNPLDRFSDRAEEYAKYRPSYPAAAIDAILAGSGNPTDLIVADIGAGTGISSRLVADRGATVWAIEPNDVMRETAQPHPLVTFRQGTAEQTQLPDHSVDLVLCCQSFHWFEPEAALAEFHRILRPQGWVALMWNERNREDAFTEQYTNIIRKAVAPQYFDRFERRTSHALALQHHPQFQNYRSQVFVHSHPLDRVGLVGIALSSSYLPKSGAAYEQLMVDLQQLYGQWTQNEQQTHGQRTQNEQWTQTPDQKPPNLAEPSNQMVNLSYRTDLFLATVRPPAA